MLVWGLDLHMKYSLVHAEVSKDQIGVGRFQDLSMFGSRL
jgi:hypothetical protein